MRRPFGSFLGDTFFARKSAPKVANRDLRGKCVVMTGGTDGMGRFAAERFAQMGADIVLLGRNAEKTSGVAGEILTGGYSGNISTVSCDLASMASVRKAADEILEQCSQIDLLINCAGANIAERLLTEDGNETNFAINYLGPVLLTHLLLDRIKQTPSAKILNLTSATQQVGTLDFEDLQLEKNWSMLTSYARAKLCFIMYGRHIAKSLEGTGVTLNSLNPGYIQTNLLRHATGFERLFMTFFGWLASPTWVGGERIVAAVLEPQFESANGEFIYEDIIMEPNPIALDEGKIASLMKATSTLLNLEYSL